VTDTFDRLHPAVAHHVVNTLGWRALRPLQAAAIEPLLAGEHVVATTPTAGGKTEAAVLPLLSRMLSEDWRGLSVLYVCPLRALLNNLHDRLSHYGRLVGRTVGLWHGDIGQPQRRRLLAEPPDLLLTTPESIESMLVSRGVDHHRWFADLRSVVVDEVHAFAGDDRGWHLLAVLGRLDRVAGRELQRIGLSATLGNPDELLAWLTPGSRAPGRVLNPPVPAGTAAEVTLDYVGSLDNAAVVISRLHRGDKRLVFVDSRARAEQLGLALRGHGVKTFVSHGSLGAGERTAAEEAFRAERDCVIVATSTLELGIDVGDLDRVLQIDAPPTVAAFLQRLGRTGRRAGVAANAHILATGDEGLLRAAAVLSCWRDGYVEAVVAPPRPLHVLAQQIVALTLQESGMTATSLAEWLGTPPVLGPDAAAAMPEVVDYLLADGYLAADGAILGVGETAESTVGRQHFLDLLSVFTSPPTFSVRHGRVEIGVVPDETLLARPAGLVGGGAHALVLAGRSWAITHVDWTRRVVQVEPTDAPGVARWTGSAQPLGATVARAIRSVLAGADPPAVTLSERAHRRLADVRAEHAWATPATTTLVVDDKNRARWWTFAGRRANLSLARLVDAHRHHVNAITDLYVAVDSATTGPDLTVCLEAPGVDTSPASWVVAEAIDGLKFADLLPRPLAISVIAARLEDPASAAIARVEPVAAWHDPGAQ